MLPASAVEQSGKEAYLQRHQTAQRERQSEAVQVPTHRHTSVFPNSPEASKLTAVVQEVCGVKHFLTSRETIFETHYNPGFAKNCNVVIH